MSGYCKSFHMKCWSLSVHPQPFTEGQVQKRYNVKIKTGPISNPRPFFPLKNIKKASRIQGSPKEVSRKLGKASRKLGTTSRNPGKVSFNLGKTSRKPRTASLQLDTMSIQLELASIHTG